MSINPGRLAAYVAPCLPIAAVGLPVVVYLPPYYAATLGLDLATVGLIFFLVRLIDVPLDPVIGHLLDRTGSRHGRFRPWMLGGAVIMMAGVYAVFMAQPGIGAGAALAGLVLMYTGYSALLVAHTAWGAVLSDDYHERSRIFGWWQSTNVLGLFTILAVPPLAQRLLPGGDSAAGIHAMGWAIIVALPLTVGGMLLCVPERQRLGEHHEHRLGDILGVLRLPLFRRLLLVDILANLAPGLTGALFLFFFEAGRGLPPAEASMLLLFYFASGIVAAPLWVRLAKRFSKHGALIAALIAYAVFQTAIVLNPVENFAVAAIAMALAGAPAVAPIFLLRAMLADLSDAETLRSRRERTGLFYAVLAAVQKLGYAIPVGLSYPILGLIGFVPALGAENSPAAIAWLTALFVGPPVVLALAAALVVRGWPIDAESQADTVRALAR